MLTRFYIALSVLAGLWVAVMLPLHYVQYKHIRLFDTLFYTDDAVTPERVQRGIDDYAWLASWPICYPQAHGDLALLYSVLAEPEIEGTEEVEEEDTEDAFEAELNAALELEEARVEELLEDEVASEIETEEIELTEAQQEAFTKATSHTQMQLKCTPQDGNVWLNYTMLLVQQEGFSEAAEQAYIQSYRMAPKEAWMAEKRLDLARYFYPQFQAEARDVMLNDIAVLERGALPRKRAIMELFNASSLDAVRALVSP